MIEVQRGDLWFIWERGRIVDVCHDDVLTPLPFDCISVPAGEVSRETVEQAAQRWIDAQS